MTPRWIRIGLPLLAAYISVSSARECWIDSSCDTRLGNGVVEDMLTDSADSVELALTLLEEKDAKVQEAFRQIFKFDFEEPGEDEGNRQIFARKDNG